MLQPEYVHSSQSLDEPVFKALAETLLVMKEAGRVLASRSMLERVLNRAVVLRLKKGWVEPFLNRMVEEKYIVARRLAGKPGYFRLTDKGCEFAQKHPYNRSATEYNVNGVAWVEQKPL
jgi:DNA-binding PadR family transcriptional regulator